MKRVQKFLCVDNVQRDLRVRKDLSGDALTITGDYSWGF